LSFGISASQQLARPLKGKAQTIKQSGNMLLVIVHAEVFFDPELEHRTAANPTTEAGSLWASLDDLLELCPLIIA